MLAALLAGFFQPSTQAEPKVAYMVYHSAEHGTRVLSGDGKPPQKFPDLSDPGLSPDGTQLVGTDFSDKGRQLEVVDLATGKSRVLPIESQEVYGGLWSPDGAWIAFHILSGKRWGVGVIRPDGTDFRLLTRALPVDHDYFFCGWNLKTGEPLAHDLETLWQLTLDGDTAWSKLLENLTGTRSISSGCRFWIAPDGKTLYGSVEVEEDEIPNMDGPSDYLITADLDSGSHDRISPKGMHAGSPFLSFDGASIFFTGFVAKDLQVGPDSMSLTMRIYRMKLADRSFEPVAENAWQPSASR